MPSFAQTLPVVLLVASTAFATPLYVARQNDMSGHSSKADAQNPAVAVSAFKQNKIACSDDKHSDKCDMEVVRRYNILELALSKRHDPSRTDPSVTAADFEHPAGDKAGDADGSAVTEKKTVDAPLAAMQSRPAVADKSAAVEDSPAADVLPSSDQQRTDDALQPPSIPAADKSVLPDRAAAAGHKRADDQRSSVQEPAPVVAVPSDQKSDTPEQSPASAFNDKAIAIGVKEGMSM